MKRRIIVIALSVISALVIAGLLLYFAPKLLTTRLTLSFEDAVSKSWVWDAKVTLQGREIRSYYQSNTGPIPMTFTHLKPGRATLTIEAPSYVTAKVPVRLHLGNNVLGRPIRMVGYQIPGLTRFIMFETQEVSGLSVQLRPINSAGKAITMVPCLDLWVGAIVSAEMKSGRMVASPVDSGATRGPVLYRGQLAWTWDASPSQDFRYRATIPYVKLSSRTVPYLVVDYLVIVPDPRKITHSQIDSIMRDAPDLSATKALRQYLDARGGDDRFAYYFATSWNVPGPGTSANSGS